MRKLVLALIAALVSAVFAPAVSALPVFARQTGFACNQCHFQHFPLLNEFGRSFKNSGFTMMGAQAKVEGTDLSIPTTLNFSALTSVGFENVSNGDAAANNDSSVNTPGSGGELSLFYGGRVSDNVGFLSELGVAGAAATGSAKLPMFYEVAEGTRAGLVFLSTDGQGAAHSFETLNTGAVGVHKMTIISGQATPAHLNVYSAAQYLGTATAAQGVSFVVNNEHYFVNVGKYALPWAPGAVAGKFATGTAVVGNPTKGGGMRMTYMRAAALFDVAGFDSAVGVQSFSGDDGQPADIGVVGGVIGQNTGTKATLIDGQMQGKVGAMPLGVYASYGVAPVITADGTTSGNLFNVGGIVDAKSLNIGAEVGVVPGVVAVMAGYRIANNGRTVDGTTATDNLTDNGMMVGVTYALAMNIQASLSYTAQSGTAWDAANNAANPGAEPAGKTVTSVMMMAVF